MHQRVLFVDDEPFVLRAVERGLRRHAGRWQLAFADSADDALEEMAKSPTDVIVTDISMPHTSGIELLHRVRQAYPDTVRVIMSGNIEHEIATGALPVAHQFVAKPWQRDHLVEVIERALRVRELLAAPALRVVLGRMSAMPSIPACYDQLARIVDDPHVDPATIAALIEHDEGIENRVLQSANSPFFGLSQRVRRVSEAVHALGGHMIKNLVLVAEVFRLFEEKRCAAGFSLSAEQHHAMLIGAVASAIAPPGLGEACFTAGLLHDLGKLIIAAEMPERWVTVATIAAHEQSVSTALELAHIGATHGEIGAYLLGIWGMPADLVEAVAFHHRPLRAGRAMLGPLAMVHLANALVGEALGEHDSLDHAYVEALGVGDQLDAWRATAREIIAMTQER